MMLFNSSLKKTFSSACLGLFFLSTSLPSFSQTPDDINRIEQQNDQIIRQQQQRLDEQRKAIEEGRKDVIIKNPQLPESGEAIDSDVCFDIATITVNGVEVLPLSGVTAVKQPYVGKCLSLNDINALLKAITALYLDAGYITTRAYLPQQNLSTGVLTIQVIEGLVESFDQSAAPTININTAFPSITGKILNLRDIEQGIEQLNRLAGNKVRMELVPGSAIGASIIRLINDAQRPWQANIRYDNSGQDSTGERQLRLYTSIDNLLGGNDFFSLSAQSDTKDQRDGQQSESLSLRYEVPYGYWLYAIDANWFEYLNRVQGQVQVFDSTGKSHRQSFTASRVLDRNQTSKTELIASLTRKKNKNYIEDVFLDTSSRTLAVGTLELRKNFFLPKNQTFQSALTYQRGLPLFGSPEAESSEEPQSEYTAWLLNANYSRALRYFDKSWYYSTRLYGQYSDDVLFGSEKVSVGSQYTVRGFKEESISSRTGGYWRNELSVSFPQQKNTAGIYNISPYFGVDIGTTKGEANTSDDETLSGAAAGLRISGKRVSAEMVYEKALQRPDHFSSSTEQFNFSMTVKL